MSATRVDNVFVRHCAYWSLVSHYSIQCYLHEALHLAVVLGVCATVFNTLISSAFISHPWQ